MRWLVAIIITLVMAGVLSLFAHPPTQMDMITYSWGDDQDE